jgi:hypothetical protein
MSRERGRGITVSIDELVLHGLPLLPAQRGPLLRAMEDELAIRFGQDRALPSRDARERALDAGAVTYDPAQPLDPDTLGRAIARVVHGGLTTWPR